MAPLLRSGLAALAGIVVGSAVNMAIVVGGAAILPPPEGVDASSAESLRAGIHLFGPEHLLSPFLAHAVGTFTGAFAAGILESPRGRRAHRFVGGFFLAGGIAAAAMIPAPAWFTATDLVLAYVPTAMLGARLASRLGTTGSTRPRA